MKITKNKIIACILILIVLAASFWYGGAAPGLQGWELSKTPKDIGTSSDDISNNNLPDLSDNDKNNEIEPKQGDELQSNSGELDSSEKKDNSRPGGDETGLSASEKMELAKKLAGEDSSTDVEEGSKDYSESQGMQIDSVTGKDKHLTTPVPEGKPIPVEPEDADITDIELSCTLTVRCDTILDNMDWLDKEKIELVPEDGVIFATKTVTFYQGESVLNVLQREMKKAKIHMEFTNTPMYNSAYIKGINNLYEFDCGEISGWMYKVNDWFPNYGCSRYQLKDGDVIEWLYTCNLGVDIGGFNSIGE